MSTHSEQQTILQFNNITAFRGKKKVMNGFNLHINEGDHTAIVGPNGAGKSTFIQLLTKQLHPLASKNSTPPIKVFGKERWDIRELRKRIGIVSSDMEYDIAHNLKGGRLSGKDVVITGFFSSMQLFNHQKVSDKMGKRADKTLKMMEAKYLSDRYFSRMSAGEARRVLIARALVTSPEMLVLDEPTTALDFVAREKCLQLIREIARQGTTVIIVTHHVEEIIPEICNVILLKKGSVAFSGPKEKVLTADHLQEVYEHPLNLRLDDNRYRVEL